MTLSNDKPISKSMPKFLTNAQVTQYHEDGYLSPINLMSVSDAIAIREQLEEAERLHPQHINAENRNNAHLVFSFLDKLAFNQIILDVVEDLIGSDYSLWGSVLFVKDPGTAHYVSWHQDATYMGMTSNDFVTPWIALSPSNRETGCMSMIPGSHKNNIRPHDDTFAKDNILTRGQVVQDVDESTAVDLILQPGQMSVHHGEIVHGSQANLSERRRVGFALQSYMSNDIRQHIGKNMWLPVRGKVRDDDAVLLHRPVTDMDEAAVAQREVVNKNFGDILYHGAEQRRNY